MLVLASIGFLPAPAAQAAGPSAPYTALYLDGYPGSWWHPGAVAYDSTNGSTFTVSATGTDQVGFRVDQGSDNWVFRMAPPTGSSWTKGADYDISLNPDPTRAYIDVSHAGATCDESPGKIHVDDVVRDGVGALTGFAATFVISCYSSVLDLHGELRWNSDTPYTAATTDVLSYDFGRHLVGSGPFTKTITITSLGTASTVFGDATFTENSGSYAVTDNTCSGTSRAYGETCTVTVTANSTKLSSDWTFLKLADNTALGGRLIQLGMTGLDPRTVTVSPATTLYFSNQTLYEVGAPQRVTVTGSGDTPDTFSPATVTGAGASNFVITADTCKGASLARNQSCYVEVAAKPTGPGMKFATLELPDNSLTSPKTVQLSITDSYQGLRGTYTPVSPQRILDTRIGLGAPKVLVKGGGVVHLQVTSRGGVPDYGVSAVVLNVTVTGTTGPGFLTVYPTGVARPNASSLNYVKGGLRSNSVTVQLSASGQADIYTSSGTQIVADVNGWYAASGSPSGYALGGQVQPEKPYRLFDSRSDWGKPLPDHAYAQLGVDYGNLNSHIHALVVNITAVNPTYAGFLTAWDGTGSVPDTSTVNYLAKSITPNFAIVPVGPCTLCTGQYYGVPSISIYSPVITHLVVDVVGFIDDGTLPDGLRFEPRTPRRIVDSRSGLGLSAKLGAAATKTVTTPAEVLTADTKALALNFTGVSPTTSTYMSVWPAGLTRPTCSTLNLTTGQIAANAAVTLLGQTNQFNVYNNSGSVDVVVDVVGTFWLYPGTATGSVSSAQGIGGGSQGIERAASGPRELGTMAPLPRKV